MDTAYIPAFVLSNNGEQVTGRLLEFRKLCSMFVGEKVGDKDPSVKILSKLTKYPPIRGVPILNNLFERVEDSAFADQMAKAEVNTNLQDDIRSYKSAAGDPVAEPAPNNIGIGITRKDYSTKKCLVHGVHGVDSFIAGHNSRYLRFLHRKTMSVSKKKFWELKETCHSHQVDVRHLQESIEAYQQMNEKCGKTFEELQTSSETFYACTFAKEGRIQVGRASLNAHQKCAQAANQYKIYQEKTKQAFKKLEPLFEAEKKSREIMNKLQEELRSLIEPEITKVITDGIKNLLKFAKSSQFPEEHTEELENFDCQSTAAKLYQELCLKYFHPVIDESYADMATARPRYDVPYFYDLDKDERRFRAYGSSACLLDGDTHGKRREELYVWSNDNLEGKNGTAHLKLKRDTKIKQKFCSADGKMAFGWIRKCACGTKKYGFYLTNATRLVP